MKASFLETRDAQDLLESPLPSMPWVVEDLVGSGLTLLGGSPKIGKSWLVLQLAYCVSEGIPFLEHATCEAEVLYLCLEDTFSRIQQRLFLLADEAKPTLHFAIVAQKISNGLFGQIDSFLNEKPNTKLVIVDTLQMVRQSSAQSNIYALDYADANALKNFADEHEIAILAVHHTRKGSKQDNVFDKISGTNGLMGAADTTLVLDKSNYYGGNATLSVTGRDIEMAEYQLAFKNCKWKLVAQTSADELREREIPSCVLQVLDFMTTHPGNWEGTSSDLLEVARIDNVASNALPKYLNEHHPFMEEHGIQYARKKTSSARLIILQKIQYIEPFIDE